MLYFQYKYHYQEALRRLLRTRTESRDPEWVLPLDDVLGILGKVPLQGYRGCCQTVRAEVPEVWPRHWASALALLFQERGAEEEEAHGPDMLYCPHDAPLFMPATLGSVLQKQVQQVANKHMERIGMSIKVIETVGKKVGGALVNLHLTGCWWPDCYLCDCKPGPGPPTPAPAWSAGARAWRRSTTGRLAALGTIAQPRGIRRT